MFVTAIGYAGLITTIWAVIVPGLLHLKMRFRHDSGYQHSRWDGLQLSKIMVIAYKPRTCPFCNYTGPINEPDRKWSCRKCGLEWKQDQNNRDKDKQ
nr:aromatic amino acid transport family protein [Pantoea allii]